MAFTVDATIQSLQNLLKRADLGTLGKASLHSNEGVNKIFGDRAGSVVGAYGAPRFMGGAHATYKNLEGGHGLIDSVKAAHMTSAGKVNYGAIAGTYMGVSAAGRIVGGGGLHRDSRGNKNVIGVPFF